MSEAPRIPRHRPLVPPPAADSAEGCAGIADEPPATWRQRFTRALRRITTLLRKQ